MASSKQFPMLKRRGKWWSYRKRVPTHLRPLFQGRREIVVSLKTRDEGEARIRVLSIAHETEKAIQRAREAPDARGGPAGDGAAVAARMSCGRITRIAWYGPGLTSRSMRKSTHWKALSMTTALPCRRATRQDGHLLALAFDHASRLEDLVGEMGWRVRATRRTFHVNDPPGACLDGENAETPTGT